MSIALAAPRSPAVGKQRRYVFGPVTSAPLGRWLGVDLVRPNWCTFDCLYCQLGRTREKSLDRVVFVQLDDLIAELCEALACCEVDFVALAGSGEPSLHAQLAPIIAAVRHMTHARVAVATNGALMHDGAVRDACGLADVVISTLAAHNNEQFQRIHRPCPEIAFDRYLDGMITFGREQPPSVWLELLLLEGLNAEEADFDAFASLIGWIDPERIHVTTTATLELRPAGCAVSPAKLRRWAQRFGPRAEAIADPRPLRQRL